MRAARAVAAVVGWQTVASVCYYTVFAATPFLREAFDVSRLLVGVVLAAATLGYTLALFPSGAAVDALGEKPVMVGGLVALAAGAAGVAVAGDYPALVVAVVLLGAAYATAMPATNRAVVESVPPGRHGVAMGVKQVGVTTGSGLAALLVVTVAPAVASWRAGFLAAAAAAVAAAVGFALVYRGGPGSGEWALPDVRGLLADPAYVALVAAGLFLGAALFTTVGYATLYLVEVAGAPAALAGVGFAAMQATGSGGRVAGGALADRLGGGAAGSATVLTWQGALGAVLLAVLALELPVAGALAVLGGVGATVLGFTGLYYACLTAIVGDDEVGAATAGGQTALNVGALAAPPAFGFLADAVSYRASWLLLAAVVGLGTGLLVVVRRRVS